MSSFLSLFKRNLCAAELLTGLYGIVSVPLIRLVNQTQLSTSSNFLALDFIVNCVALLPPTFLMGLTSPLIISMVKNRLSTLGTTVGFFYGSNVAGAAFGSILAGFVFIGLVGLSRTAQVFGFVEIFLGILFYFLFNFKPSNETGAEADAGKYFVKLPLPTVLACFVFGFITLAYEMILFRTLSNHFTMFSIIFPITLAAFLFMMSFGEIITGLVLDKVSSKHFSFVFVALLSLAAISTVIIYNTPVDLFLLRSIDEINNLEGIARIISTTIIFMMPVLFLSGFFPAVIKISTKNIADAGSVFAIVLFVFTIGNIFGAFLTATLVFEIIGTVGAIYACIVLGALGIILTFWSDIRRGHFSYIAGACIVATLLIISKVPYNYYSSFPATNDVSEDLTPPKPVEVVEGSTGVVSIFRLNSSTLVRMFRTPTATIFDSDFADLNKWNMSSLFVYDKEFRPKRILIIGLGGAQWLYGLTKYDFVENITAVELSPEVLKSVIKYAPPYLKSSFQESKANLIVADGRRYLQKAIARGEQFDLIQIGVFQPWMSGASNLYTKEFFTQIKQALTPGGYAVTIDLASIARAGLEEFNFAVSFPQQSRYVYFTDKTINHEADKINLDKQMSLMYGASTFKQFEAQTVTDLEDLQACTFDKQSLQDYLVNTDDHPVLEYWLSESIKPKYGGAWKLFEHLKKSTTVAVQGNCLKDLTFKVISEKP